MVIFLCIPFTNKKKAPSFFESEVTRPIRAPGHSAGRYYLIIGGPRFWLELTLWKICCKKISSIFLLSILPLQTFLRLDGENKTAKVYL